MLLKCSNSDRKVIISSSKGNGASLARGTGMRMIMSTASTMTPRIHRKGFRTPSKRYPGKALPGKFHSMSRIGPGKIAAGKKILSRPNPPPCDNSNDSGFGFDQHVEHLPYSQQSLRTVPLSRSEYHDDLISTDGSDDIILSSRIPARTKRRKIESSSIIHIENEDACSNDAFIQKIATTTATATSAVCSSLPSYTSTTVTATKYFTNGSKNASRPGLKRPSSQMQTNTFTTSKDGTIQLEIIQQPEQQHRARYQTEGSRGAVKDRSGNGFPIVKLSGTTKPTTLQVFIGTDIGRIAPHMFYQACKVAGKNSTPCNEKKIDGTMIIEIDFKPEASMTITCDCVGILKERNVDVEHRFPDQSAQRNKKKSTRCRMIFRAQIILDDGSTETLQLCSQPIICTQPPGVPEICKKSLNSSPVDGGLELYVIGKNFLKDTVVVFRENDEEMGQMGSVWEQRVIPDKEYLQQTHLICVVPPYIQQNIIEPITIQFFIMSSGKRSESHNFMYLPKGRHTILSASTTINSLCSTMTGSEDGIQYADNTSQSSLPQSLGLWSTNSSNNDTVGNMLEPKHEMDSGMMPPPSTTTVPIGVRRPSNGLLTEISLQQIVASNNNTNNGGNLKNDPTDEINQTSMQNSLQTDTSLSQFSINNDNPMDRGLGHGHGHVHGHGHGQQDIQPYQRNRRTSIHLIEMPNILNDDRMQGFTNASNSTAINQTNEMKPMSVDAAAAAAVAAVELAVKQEQIANEIQNNFFNAAVVAQNQQQVNKFLSSLDTSLNGLQANSSLESVNNPVNTIFVNSAGVNSVSANIQSHDLFAHAATQQTASHTANDLIHQISPNSLSPLSIEQQFATNMLMNNNNPPTLASPVPLNQILNLAHNDSVPELLRSLSASSCSSSSSSSSSTSSPSNHHDIILNSEPAASINSVNMQIMSHSANSTSPQQHQSTPQITSDLILNTDVSPSVLCSGDSDSMLVNHHHHQVTMTNSILNDINNINSLSAPTAEEAIINNIIMQQQQSQVATSVPTVVEHREQQQQQQSSTANANMIIKAAADYISCQEQHIRTTESTINALMSLNSNPIISTEHQQQQVSQLLNMSPTSLTSAISTPQLANSNSNSSMTNGLCQPSQQILNPFSSSNATVLTTNNSVPLVNILINHHDPSRASDYLNNNQTTQLVAAVSPQQNQESLLHAVSLAAQSSGLEKPKITGGSAVEQIAAIAAAAVAQTSNLQQQPTTTPASSTTAIPQEITIMSDQDLISYINPSTFDQV